ncbi:MAG: APC family permease [Streptosporangiaceae bacterium]|nr:APC family permease [Streptosporangiaceae bacterium]
MARSDTEAGASAGAAEDYDVSRRSEVAKLRKGAIGLGGVLFLTVTGSAPITAMMLNVPIMVGSGQGTGAPAAFLFAAIVLVVFSVGYVAMARKKTTAGGFYSFISHGLGRDLGLGTGFASVAAYSVFEASLAGGFAYFLGGKLNAFGVNVSWPWLALGMVALIGVLTYFDVSFSSRILALGLITEVLILIIFDIVLFARGHSPSASALNPVNAFKALPAQGKLVAGSVGLGLFFAFWSWVGFEMAPNYGEESRDPKRNVPRALYISVIGLGVFYTLTSWASLSGYANIHDAATQSLNSAYNYFLAPAGTYGGRWLASVMSYLIITGSFACGMAFHNTTARYFYSLGREGMLPSPLGRTHQRWQSPHIASITQSVIAAIVIALFAIFAGTGNPATQAYGELYGLMAVMGVIIILSVQALVSFSIAIYYLRFHRDEVHWWKTLLAPALSFVSQAFVVYLLFANFSSVAGTYPLAKWLGPIDAVVAVAGVGAAFWFKYRRPAKYELAGRLINEGL